MEKKPTTEQQTLQQQIEYYLSDTNLSRDQFFHSKIQNDDEGYLPIELIENCNKVKKLGASRAQILEAINNSELLEVSEDNESLRRAGNKPLPEFRAQKNSK